MSEEKTMKKTSQLIRFLLALAALLVSSLAGAGTTTYFHNDLAGSPVAATNASGQMIWKEKYRPYGERIVNSPASADNEVWFTSRRQDVDTGLVYMGARYYDPVAGRFISTDPKTFDEKNEHSFNRYAYANNNPYVYVDPDGRMGIVIRCLAQPSACLTPFARAAQVAYSRIQMTVNGILVSPAGQVATQVAAAEVGVPTYSVPGVLARALQE